MLLKEKFKNLSLPLKNSFYLLSGNIVFQVINLLFFLYLARELGPTLIGEVNSVRAYVGFFAIFGLGGVNTLVVKEISKKNGNTKIIQETNSLRIIATIITVLICSVTLYFTDYELYIKKLIFGYSSFLILAQFHGVLNSVYRFTEKMKYITIFNNLEYLSFALLAFILIVLKFDPVYVILSVTIIMKLVWILISYLNMKKKLSVKISGIRLFSKSTLYSTLIFSGIGILSTLATQIDLLMISFLGTSYDVGIYSIPQKIVGKFEMFNTVLFTAFFPILTRLNKEKIISKIFNRKSFISLITLLFLIINIILFSKYIIVFMFGLEYIDAVPIMKILSGYILLSFFIMIFNIIFQAQINEKISFLIVFCMAISNIFFNILFFKIFGLKGIAISTLMVNTIGLLIYIYFFKKWIKVNENEN